MIERTVSLDLNELPRVLQIALTSWLKTREQQESGRGVVRVQLLSVDASYRAEYEDDVPAGLPDSGRPERTHEDFGSRLPRSHDPRDNPFSHDPLRTRPGWARDDQWRDDEVGCPISVDDPEPRAGQLPIDWDPQY